MSVFAILPSGGEILVALIIGLLLFGGRLPEVAKDLGRTFFKMRRAMNDLRRESGIDETIRDLQREIEEARPVVDLNARPYQKWPPEAEETDDEGGTGEDDGPVERRSLPEQGGVED
ncbi:MAG: twin-arginine translocase TatA/TatE family subunit [Planctomycetota bacterium]|nr:MAG: twin-arginine translocase TatA/TatE family subunit [Planctomycetota bacterium]